MTSGYNNQSWRQRFIWSISHPPIATFVLLSAIALFSTLIWGWFSGSETITQFFTHLHLGQKNPPIWIQAPEISKKYLLLPTIALITTALAVIKISPRPKLWSQAIIVAIVLALMIRYILWRSLSSLNFSDPLNGTFSLGLLFFEVFIWISGIIRLWLMLKTKNRTQQANQMQINVQERKYTPSVDIFIPTYKEPSFILKRTIMGCQAIDYPHKTIYLLDDSRRPDLQKMAQELGCKYIARPDNFHAKAGNLNHALPLTRGELIAVFDADFIPTRNFLTRTVGFFQDKNVGLVQTPQSFYNPDPIARNLGLDKVLNSAEEVFYRQIERLKDGVNSAVCAGTSFVVKRHALEEVGGFVTESTSEDYFTGIRLSAQGYELIYLNEKLSAGLAAEDTTNYFVQRERWGRGTLQAFFINANPLTIRGLTASQRLAHLEGLMNWLSIWAYTYFLMMPLAYAFLGVFPVKATSEEWLYFFVPYYLVQLVVFRWLNYQSRSVIISGIYEVILCIPLSLAVFLALINPFQQKFKVTQKGLSSYKFTFNWTLGLPLIVLFGATLMGLLRILGLWGTVQTPPEVAELTQGFSLILIWSVYNLLSIVIALLALIDAPKSDPYDWFELQKIVCLKLANQTRWGITTKISEVGVEIKLSQELNDTENIFTENQSLPVQIDLVEEGLKLTGEVTHYTFFPSSLTLNVKFKEVSLSQHRQLVEMLFCRQGQWKERTEPGELHSLFLILQTLFNPPFLRKNNRLKHEVCTLKSSSE